MVFVFYLQSYHGYMIFADYTKTNAFFLGTSTITGGDTTPEMPPIFNQKSKVNVTNHAKIKYCPLFV